MADVPAMEHNYIKKMLAMQARGELPMTVGVHQLTVWHDGWCGIYRQERCSCDPDVALSWSLPAGSEN